MSTWPTKHLTADELDSFHSASVSGEAQLHVETCTDCQRLVAADRALVQALAALPSFAPTSGFVDRVMASVQVRQPAKVPLLSYPTISRRALAWAFGLTVVALGSAVWSAAHLPLIHHWLDLAALEMRQSAWLGIRGLGANLIEQPWFESVREWMTSPLRVISSLAAGLGVSVLALLALRRLVRPLPEAAIHAKW
jgi:hypothetical protein